MTQHQTQLSGRHANHTNHWKPNTIRDLRIQHLTSQSLWLNFGGKHSQSYSIRTGPYFASSNSFASSDLISGFNFTWITRLMLYITLSIMFCRMHHLHLSSMKRTNGAAALLQFPNLHIILYKIWRSCITHGRTSLKIDCGLGPCFGRINWNTLLAQTSKSKQNKWRSCAHL